jgi:steroid 5-alpha reductase family enzyme
MKAFDKQKDAPPVPDAAILRENRAHRILVQVLLLMMAVEWIVLLMEDHSGLTDTMWDMIVNATGALIISFVG